MYMMILGIGINGFNTDNLQFERSHICSLRGLFQLVSIYLHVVKVKVSLFVFFYLKSITLNTGASNTGDFVQGANI